MGAQHAKPELAAKGQYESVTSYATRRRTQLETVRRRMEAQRQQAQDAIAEIDRELAHLDTMDRAMRDVGQSSDVESIPANTIKDLAVLAIAGEGRPLRIGELLDRIRLRRPDLMRSTLDTQMKRLMKEGRVMRQGLLWTLATAN